MRDKTTMGILKGIDKRDGTNKTNDFFSSFSSSSSPKYTKKTSFNFSNMLKQYFPILIFIIVLMYLNKIFDFFRLDQKGSGAIGTVKDLILGSGSTGVPRDFGAPKTSSSYPMTEDFYQSIATQQLEIMDSLITTDADFIKLKTPLKLLSIIELKKVAELFGTVPYSGVGKAFWGTELDLFGWYNKELNISEISQMKQIFKPTGLYR